MKKFLTAAFAAIATLGMSTLVMAEEHAAAAADAVTGGNGAVAALALAAGFGIAVAAFGGALAQGKAAAAALEGIARNPGAAGKIQTPMIIALALIESLVIYAFVVALILQGKI
ncbi:MAG: F0F1 ATP synthase subunit C [Deltaproteobacteria bacterium CG11_big_fil_rev_8_21_14_0_20_47_16]|nr:MAG: F0F1 ATP synthase subunit C [Deltaproteobacteria bacterium CG11_big_fil_rev_8_21_14_0_20_47_16]